MPQNEIFDYLKKKAQSSPDEWLNTDLIRKETGFTRSTICQQMRKMRRWFGDKIEYKKDGGKRGKEGYLYRYKPFEERE